MCIRNLKEIFPKIKYVSVGDGEERNNLIKLVKELKIDNEVTLLSEIDGKLKNALLKKSNLFLMPSIFIKNQLRVLEYHLLKLLVMELVLLEVK